MKLNKYIPFEMYNIHDGWGTSFVTKVPKIIQMITEGRNPDEWDDDLFWEYFDNYRDQCVSSLRQGAIPQDARAKIKAHWSDSGLKDILMQIAQDPLNLHWDLYKKVYDIVDSYTTGRHYEAATTRMIVTLQPEVFSTVVTNKHLSNIVAELNMHHIEDFPYDVFYSYSDTLHKNWILQTFLKNEYNDHAPMEIGTIAWRIPDMFEEKNKSMKDINVIRDLLLQKNQIILQGAPGTGKTYSTAQIALATIGVKDIDLADHESVMKRYKELHKIGQIEFVTFHMSMDYEDFVEGIKPESDGNSISYDIEDGIFKKICEDAASRTSSNFDAAYDGFIKDIAECTEEEPHILTTITGKKFGVCPNSKGNLSLLTGPKLQKNGVLRKGEIEEAAKGNEDADWYYYSIGVVNHLKQNYNLDVKAEHKQQNYVLIIDEINRGNVSKIFGELITLLEADKRAGGDHPLSVRLPYSKKDFSVPDNLYIIGTMNTTDRSVGSLDYALRRRFAFVTITAHRHIIEEYYNKIGDEDLRDIACERFSMVKEFLNDCKSDMDIDDLMVGHSFFMAPDRNKFDLKWKYEVLPLLDEYYKDGIINKKWDNSNL